MRINYFIYRVTDYDGQSLLQQQRMRAFSRDAKSSYYKYQSMPRNLTQEKRLQELHTLKDNEIKVGIYKYSTEDELGKGYSSKVYKGVQIEKIHKRYAIKVIELKKFRGSNLQMLEAQIEIHRNLIHDNIVRLYQVIKTPYYYYIIMEYCPHGNLHQYIKQKKKLSETNALEIMDQVLAGSRYLMDQGVIHRDLKPANILRIGNKWKISDFGFSVKSRYGFKDRINVGTPLYMSPESLKKSYYSAKTDIFALGVTLFEMVQGHTPWESRNEKELLEKMKEEVVIPPTIKHPKIKQFIEKTCQLNENKRMSREELLQFQLIPKQDNTGLASSDKSSALASSVSRAVANHSKRQSLLSEWIDKEAFSFETELDCINRQFLLAKHLYSCIRNSDSFLIQKEDRQRFALLLYKLLLKVIRSLTDKKQNGLKLNNWEELTSSKPYKELYESISDAAQIYQKEYLQQIKLNDIKNIRTVNKRFPDLCNNHPLSPQFYQTLQEYLIPLIRIHNHELMILQIDFQSQGEAEVQQSSAKLLPSSATKIEDIHIKSDLQVNYEVKVKSQREIFPPSEQVELSSLLLQPKKESRLQIKKLSKQESKLSEDKSFVALQEKKDSKVQTKKLSLKDKYQALEALYTIFRLTQLRSSKEEEKTSTIEKITLQENFMESSLEKQDYLDLRRLLRGI